MAVTVLADRLEETPDPDLRERLSRGVGIVRGSGRILRWVVAAFFAGLGLFMLVLQVRVGRGMMPLALLGPMLGMLMLSAGVFWGDFGYNHRRIARRLLDLNLCPSCGQDLSGACGQGNLLLCRCGAAWKARPARSSP
jgi:hypothetical protein